MIEFRIDLSLLCVMSCHHQYHLEVVKSNVSFVMSCHHLEVVMCHMSCHHLEVVMCHVSCHHLEVVMCWVFLILSSPVSWPLALSSPSISCSIFFNLEIKDNFILHHENFQSRKLCENCLKGRSYTRKS